MRAAFEKITGSNEDSSFVCRKLDVPAFPFEWHFHPELELTLILRGRGQRFVGDHIGDFREGDLVLLGPNLPHTWHSGPTRAGGRCQAIVVQFPRELLAEPVAQLQELRGVGRLLDHSGRGIQFGARAHRDTAAQLADLPSLPPLRRLTGLLEVLDRLSRDRRSAVLSGPRFLPQLRHSDQQRMDHVSRFIDSRFTDPISLTDAAKAAGLSESAFARLFRRATGKRFTQYLNEVRIGAACRSLRETDRSIADIAMSCGFNNLSNFNRQFMRIKHMTPMRFRAPTVIADQQRHPRRKH